MPRRAMRTCWGRGREDVSSRKGRADGGLSLVSRTRAERTRAGRRRKAGGGTGMKGRGMGEGRMGGFKLGWKTDRIPNMLKSRFDEMKLEPARRGEIQMLSLTGLLSFEVVASGIFVE